MNDLLFHSFTPAAFIPFIISREWLPFKRTCTMYNTIHLVSLSTSPTHLNIYEKHELKN